VPPAPPEAAAQVRAFRESDVPRWDAYVARHPRATFYHQTGWKRVLEAAFPHRAYYLVAESGGAVRGVLPLFLCRGVRGRLGLYSLPHTVFGGPLGDDAAVEEALLEEARNLGSALGARVLELRNRHESLLDLPVQEGNVTFEKEIPASADEVKGTFPKNARAAINQAVKRHGLTAGFTGELDVFYDVLGQTYHRLGSPLFPRAFFAAMLAEFPDDALVHVVRQGDTPVAAALCLVWRGVISPVYSGQAHGAQRLNADNFKYFDIMRRAVERGLTGFDLGKTRTSNTGGMRFKKHQGFSPTPLPYQVVALVPGAGGGSSDPTSGFFLKARRLWSKLPPGVAGVLGRRLVRFFP